VAPAFCCFYHRRAAISNNILAISLTPKLALKITAGFDCGVCHAAKAEESTTSAAVFARLAVYSAVERVPTIFRVPGFDNKRKARELQLAIPSPALAEGCEPYST
jgi:hypothetical protein